MGINKKVILILLVAGAVAGGGYYALTDQTENVTPPSDATTETIPEPSNVTKTQPEQTTDKPNTSANQTENDGTVIITSASETSVRTLIEGYSSGTCTLTLSKKGQSDITRFAKIVFAPPSNYTCGGFSFNKSIFPVGGAWTAKVVVVNGSKKVESESKEIYVN